MEKLSSYFKSEEELREFIEQGIRGIERWIAVCGNAPPSEMRDAAIRFSWKQIEKWQGIYMLRYGHRYVPELTVMQGCSDGAEKTIRRNPGWNGTEIAKPH